MRVHGIDHVQLAKSAPTRSLAVYRRMRSPEYQRTAGGL